MKKALSLLLSICLIFIDFSFVQTEEKPVLAVLTLSPQNVSKTDANIITGFLQEEFFYTRQYELVERTQVDEILKEYEYQQSGVCDIACAVELGKQLAANKVIMGTVGKLGEVYSIQIKLVDVETSKIEEMSSIRAKCQLGDLPTYIDDLVDKFFSLPKKAKPKVEKLPRVEKKEPSKKEEKEILELEETNLTVKELPKELKKAVIPLIEERPKEKPKEEVKEEEKKPVVKLRSE